MKSFYNFFEIRYGKMEDLASLGELVTHMLSIYDENQEWIRAWKKSQTLSRIEDTRLVFFARKLVAAYTIDSKISEHESNPSSDSLSIDMLTFHPDFYSDSLLERLLQDATSIAITRGAKFLRLQIPLSRVDLSIAFKELGFFELTQITHQLASSLWQKMIASPLPQSSFPDNYLLDS